VAFSLLTGWAALAADAPPLPPGDKEPLLRVEAGGPTSYVTALAFTADGKTLYAGGWDKVVRVWALNDKGQFVPDRVPAYRVPLGPGNDGAINALALSDDGTWLAAAGKGIFGAAGTRQVGFLVPSEGMTDEMRLYMGTIYVFNTRDQSVRLLRGHSGVVDALAFAPSRPGKPPLLLSVALEPDSGPRKYRRAARLWDVDRAESVASLGGLPDCDARPVPAVWHSGKDLRQVRVALPLEDGLLRVWDAAGREKNLWEVPIDRYNMTAAYIPGPGGDGPARFLTAEYGTRRARLTLWEAPLSGEPKPAVAQTRPPEPDSYPRALSLLASNADGKPDLAAVALRVPNRGEQYRLQVVGLGPENLGAVRADEVLWQGSARQPVLATSLRGRHLAVAGNEGHEIRIYSVASLLRKDGARPQVLRSSGVPFRHVSFASDGKNLALLLNRAARKTAGQPPPAAAPDRGDWIFHFPRRRLTGDAAGWKTVSPDLRGWRARYAGGEGRRSVSVYQGERLVGRIGLPGKEELSDYALLPPIGAVTVPLLALATHEDGQPRLALYDAASGDLLRQFTGHVDRIYALAFSPDGRLLASTAEDQTVCVWSLTDLGDVRGQHGRLAGVGVVRTDRHPLVVGRVEADSPARGKLRREDVIAGVVEKGKLRPLDSPLAFYEALFRMRPGQEVTLRRGDAAGGDDVTLPVSQGADERKPLLSLFVVRGEKGDRPEDCEWIGWNPVGPYDCSSPRAERSLGWHFNTGDPKRPTRFAPAVAHRKDYYREGILQKWVTDGAVGRVEAPKFPPPVIVLCVEEGGRNRALTRRAPLEVSHPRVTLKLEVRDRPLESLGRLTWKLDGGAETNLPLDRPDEGPFAVPLLLGRGEHTVVLTAWTRDVPPQPFREHLTLRFRPPAPRVTYRGEARQLFVEQPAFDLKALVHPGLPGEEVEVTLRHVHDRKALLAEGRAHRIDPDKPLAVERRLELRPGTNLIEVVAVNRGAPAGSRAQETDRLPLEVFYFKKARPPVITLNVVTPRPGGGDEVVKVEPSRPVVVHAAAVRLTGQIEASEDLVEAEWFRGEAARGAGLTGFVPNKAKRLTIHEELALRPGRQTFRFRARTATSDPAEPGALTIDYRPPLPTVRIREPRRGYALDGEKDTAVVRLRAEVRPPADRQPYRAAVLVNGKELSQAPHIDERAGALTADVPVGPGESRIEVRLSNDWGTPPQGDETRTRYRRPPRVLGPLTWTRAGRKPALDLEARVSSPLPLLRESVKAEVNGQEAAAARVRIAGPKDGAWVVRLEEVPLEAGSKENHVRLWVSNAEATCREPGAVTVATASVLPPPAVEFLSPRQNQVVLDPDLEVRFQVRSVSALTKVQLVVEGQPPLPADLGQVQRGPEGQYELTVTLPVKLTRRLNNLYVEAVNAGGRRVSPPLVVNYVPPPFRVEIAGLELRPRGQRLEPKKLSRGRLQFGELEHGRARLHGRILWADDRTARAAHRPAIRVFVNGFQQGPGSLLAPTGPRETPFQADLVLNRDKGNRVSVAVTGQDGADSLSFEVDCRQPVREQRLHLLILSASRKRPDELRKEVEGAVRTPAFAQVETYGTLTGSEVHQTSIYSQLIAIQDTVRGDLARGGRPMNEVVMIYYQGGEALTAEGNLFRGAGAAPGLAIQCDKLVEYLSEIPGAHVLLLDVDRDPAAPPRGGARDKIDSWKDDYPQVRFHVGVLRCAWRGKGPPPKEARLITALGKATTRAARLHAVIEQTERLVAAAGTSDLLVFTPRLPEDLNDLLVGRPR
jgi:WD40 repeat protein